MNGNLWAAQFQDIDVQAIAASPFGTVIVDAYDDGNRPFTAAEVRTMGGGAADPRLTLAYMSVGEAGTYRTFWKPGWNDSPPAWVGTENPDWAGDYQVRFWDAGWRAILTDYLDDILDAGFDGTFLDVVDVYQSAMAEDERADPAADMVRLVTYLSDYAKSRNPDFKIYINNAEELVAEPGFLDAIDGINKEDLYYGVRGAGVRNTQAMIDWSTALLEKAAAAGKAVLVTEYVTNGAGIQDVIDMATDKGFLLYVARADLSELDYVVANLLDAAADGRTLRGTNGDDRLTGGAGDDAIFGFQGDDVLKGGLGDDRLEGKAGRDVMTGGDGDDTFVFSSYAHSPAGALWDVVGDFSRGDHIDLSAMDANAKAAGNQAFKVVGEFSGHAGELEYSLLAPSGGLARYLVQADVNGDGHADFALMLRMASGAPALTNGNFLL